MPHKRAKASIRKARKAEVDLPVANEDSNVLAADTPKSFTRLFKFKEMAIKKQIEKKEAKNNSSIESQKKIVIQPGEKMKDFFHRVESEYKSDVISAQKKAKPVSDRKKRNQDTRKQKKQAKVQKQLDLYGGRDFDDLKDTVKFGEVADAPPVLNKIPKARGRGKELLQTKNPQASKASNNATATATTEKKNTNTGYESEEDENMKALKASHKRKIQSMSAAARIQLDNERENAIEAYRAKKAKRMAK